MNFIWSKIYYYLVTGLLSGAFFLPLFTSASIIITEVMCNPVGSDAEGEWVKIKNTGTDAVDITGWKFNDGSNHNLNVPPKNGGVGDMTLDPSETALLANKAENVTGASTIIDTVMSLNNTTDTLSFINGDTTVHSITYTVPEGGEEGVLCYGGGATDTATTTPSTSSSPEGRDSSRAGQTQKGVVVTEVTKYNTVTIEPPQDIHLRLSVPEVTNIGTYTRFVAEVYDATGKILGKANIEWSFGDAATARGREVRHMYKYPGTYAVSAYVKDGALTDEAAVQIKVVETNVSIRLDDEYEFIEVLNNSEYNLDLSGWILRSGYKSFNIPERTMVLPRLSVYFSTDVTNLSTLKREKHALLLDSARNTMADSREYKQEQSVPLTTEGAGQATTTQEVQVAYSAEQDESSTWYVANNQTSSLEQPTVEDLTYNEEVQVQQEILHTQLAAAVVSAENSGIIDSGVKWLFGLLSVIGFGMFTLKSFRADPVKDEQNLSAQAGSSNGASDFEITEIK